MDLLDFDQTELYFDESLSSEVEHLLAMAAVNYGSEDAELMLLRANLIAPQHLVVAVALYRYYFYQHRLEDALLVANNTLVCVGQRLGFLNGWRNLTVGNVGVGVMHSMGLLRFYLLLLKATAYVHLRQGELETGKAMLEKLLELDSHDRIGGKALLDVLQLAAVE